jgi:CO/xanthine dehydrogenase FAD-binding subunit
MTVLSPTTIEDALDALATHGDAMVLAGGTDFMVEVNFGHRRPGTVVSLRHVAELRTWTRTDDRLRIGAAVTYCDVEHGPIGEWVPALAQAARTVGSPQIRNAGTIGGNLATASPAGDTLPVLVALDATIECASTARGRRDIPAGDFFTGPKRSQLAPDELVVAVTVPVLDGPQEFLKVGTRNAMVISVASVALLVDGAAPTIRCALGSVGPTPIRARTAEEWVTPRIEWPARRLDGGSVAEFARRVADAARPIDDHRATAAYRRHAIEVCARRALTRAKACCTCCESDSRCPAPRTRASRANAAAARSSSTTSSSVPASCSPRAPPAARSRRSSATMPCRPCSRRSSRPARSSAGSARPASSSPSRSCSRPTRSPTS